MPRDMFSDVVEPSIKVGSQKWYTVPLSIIVHTALIGAVIIIPLMAADALPTPPVDDGVRGCGPPPPPPHRRLRRLRRPGRGAQAGGGVNPAAAPVEAPRGDQGRDGRRIRRHGSSEGVEGGVVRRRGRGHRRRACRRRRPPPPPPAATRARSPSAAIAKPPIGDRGRMRPVYPPIAQSARVQGVVIIEATIGPNGKVQTRRCCGRFRCSTRRRSTR